MTALLATAAQLKAMKGEDRLTRAFPELEPAELDARVDAALRSASEEVAGYLASRYADRLPTLDATTCPAPLRDRVIVLAWWFLLRDGSDLQAEPAHRDYKDALSYLQALQNGSASLIFERPTPVDVTTPEVLSADPRTVLRDFVGVAG